MTSSWAFAGRGATAVAMIASPEMATQRRTDLSSFALCRNLIDTRSSRRLYSTPITAEPRHDATPEKAMRRDGDSSGPM